jgi:hypothetical protein
LVKAVLCAGELEPARQLLQLALPAQPLYLPATHAVHAPPSAPDHPALQVQLLKSVLCAGELEFAGQFMQLSAPAELLYFPATHAVHAPPLAPDQPALQVQAAKAVLCAGEFEFAGHVKQVDVPVVCEYVPPSHTLQTASPLTFLCLPASHAVQAPPLLRQYPTLQEQLVFDTLPRGAFEFSGHGLHTRCDFVVHAAAWKNPAVQLEQSGSGSTGSTTKVVRCVHMHVTCVELMRCAKQPSGRYELLASSQ